MAGATPRIRRRYRIDGGFVDGWGEDGRERLAPVAVSAGVDREHQLVYQVAGISRSHCYDIKSAFEKGRDGLAPVVRRSAPDAE